MVSYTEGVEVGENDAQVRASFCSDTCADTFAVTVAPSVPAGTSARFRCKPETGDAYEFEFPIEAAEVDLRVAGIRISGDGNGDGVLNPGETAEIHVRLRNHGAAAVTTTRGIVGALTEGITISANDETISYYRCAAGADCGDSSFRVTVAPDATPGTLARFASALVDAQEATWPIELAARVEASAARPLLDGYRTGGAPLAPGYSGTLHLRLQNAGPTALTGSTCTVTSDAPWLAITTDASLRYYHCPADADCGESSVTVRVDDDAPPRGQATFACDLMDAEQQAWPVSLVVALE